MMEVIFWFSFRSWVVWAAPSLYELLACLAVHLSKAGKLKRDDPIAK
jgi:hypothetical protein